MSDQKLTTYKGLEALALIPISDLAPDPVEESAAPDATICEPCVAAEPAEPTLADAEPPDFEALMSELESAGNVLAQAARQDEEARALARRDVEEYDALRAAQDEADRALERAREVRRDADALAMQAFTDEARGAAERVAVRAAATEAQAARVAEQRRAAVDGVASDRDLERLLAERRRHEEAEKARAASAEVAARLSGALARASEALAASRIEEARELLGPVANENPGNPDVESLMEIIARRELESKSAAAEDALWLSRREWRREPRAAVERLAALDTIGLPEPVARQVFGAWAQASKRLCQVEGLADPLRYAPDPGRGAILARESAEGTYVVVSALSVPALAPGTAAPARLVGRARPLR